MFSLPLLPSRRLRNGFKCHPQRLRGFCRIIQPLETDDMSFAIFHQDHFLARFFADVFRLGRPNHTVNVRPVGS